MDLSSLGPLINFGMALLVWLAQIIIYPSFANWHPDTFTSDHRLYVQRMGYIAGPLMVVQLLLTLSALIDSGHWLYTGQLVLITICWLCTVKLIIPLHRSLSYRYNRQLINQLISANWLRTIPWTLVSLLDVTLLLL